MLPTADLYTTLAVAQDAVRNYTVNVTLSVELANTARGISGPVYRLVAKGTGIGASEAVGYGPSPEQAINMLKRATKTAWDTHQNAAQAARVARANRS